MNRSIQIILLALLALGCESERIPYEAVHVVASGGDSVRVEYLKNDVNIVNDDTTCTPIHVSELIEPGAVGERLQMIWFRSKQGPCGFERPTLSLFVEVDDSVRYGTMENVIYSLQEMSPTAFQFTVESRDSIGHTSTVINVPPNESDDRIRISRANLLIFHIDGSNSHWWTWDMDGPTPFDPVGGDSLFNLLLYSQKISPLLSMLIVVHPDALFNQFMNFFDNVAIVASALNDDKEFMAFYFEANRDMIDTTRGYEPRIMIKPWDKRDTRKLERDKESAEPIRPSSLKRKHPADVISFPKIMPRPQIAAPKLNLPDPAKDQ
ncbi:MAG: hypothetical protein ABIK83_08010 [Candidatus Zixiibacteriota bacterium]